MLLKVILKYDNSADLNE